MTDVAVTDDYFGLFGLPARFALDTAALESAWRAVAARVHPDRYATASPAEKRVAMQWAARANEAYRCLREPLTRARYLCERHGVDLRIETDTAMAPAFLMQQMQWREQLDDARRDAGAAADLRVEIDNARAAMAQLVGALIDEQGAYPQAAVKVREWMFMEKLAQELAEVL